MARPGTDSPVTLSVLDRLIDREPSSNVEAYPTRTQSVREYRAAVRRDLEWLLNTRRIAIEPHQDYREVNKSAYVYGLPDLTSFSIAGPKEHARLLRFVQTLIKLFEPRLANVRITPVEETYTGRTLHFRLEALLLMDPAPEQVSFDTVMKLTSGEYTVKEEGDAR